MYRERTIKWLRGPGLHVGARECTTVWGRGVSAIGVFFYSGAPVGRGMQKRFGGGSVITVLTAWWVNQRLIPKPR